MKRIHFTTERRDEGVIFNVFPARPMSLWRILAAVAVFIAIMQMRYGLVGLCLLGAWVFVVVRFLNRWWKVQQEPVVLFVDRTGIAVRGEVYPANDLAELLLWHPQTAASRPYNVAFAGGGIGGALGAAAFQGAMNAGSTIAAQSKSTAFSLMLRRRSNSVPVTLMTGLTEQAGHALMTDVLEAMR